MVAQSLNTMNDLFVLGLQEVYGAETQSVVIMPKFIDTASTRNLKLEFQHRKAVYQEQISRLEDVFELMDMQPQPMVSCTVQGMIDDSTRILEASGNSIVKDAALVAMEQKMEHFQIASYGTLRTWAQDLGYDDIADKLQISLKEDYKADKDLTDIAQSEINMSAPMM